MGWFSDDDLGKAHNEGQSDGAKNEYTGTLLSGRSLAEQDAYNDGFAHGKGTADKASGNFDLGYIGNKSYLSGRDS